MSWKGSRGPQLGFPIAKRCNCFGGRRFMKDTSPEKDKEVVQSILALDKDKFERWKYFEDRAAQLRERLWTAGTWLATILSAALALPLTAKFLQVGEGATLLAVRSPIPLFCVAVFGLAFSVYSLLVLKDHKEHIETNWQRANFVRTNEYMAPPKFRRRGWTVLWAIIGLQLAAFATFALLASGGFKLLCSLPSAPPTQSSTEQPREDLPPSSQALLIVQSSLTALGYDAGNIDGKLGPRTRAAVRLFQQRTGLPVTGQPDAATRQALWRQVLAQQ
jgi:hypothetical protein